MSKKAAPDSQDARPAKGEIFTFGDPVPVLDQRDFSGYFHAAWNGRWYEPPISYDGLAKALTANAHHQSAIIYKTNLIASHFIPHKLLSRSAFKALALNHMVYGTSWLERRDAMMGNVLELKPTLSRWTRVGKDGLFLMLIDGVEHEFASGTILQLSEPDISQEIYGMPGYTGAMQSALLNEAATLFRRKYYVNGSHAGFILYATDAELKQDDVESMRKALRQAKGPGNFRNLFMYAPGGKKDGLQLIPISEVGAKDDFYYMKNVTRDDVLSAHRIPPQLLGIIPSNAGGFGSVADAAKVFYQNEIVPLMTTFLEINDWLGEEVVAFRPYDQLPVGQPAPADPSSPPTETPSTP